MRRCRNYKYLEGSEVGRELEDGIKFYKSARHTDGLALMTTFETEAEHILARLCDKSVITMKNTYRSHVTPT